MSNLTFGRTIQNNIKQRDIQLAKNVKTRNRLTSSVSFKVNKISDFLQIFEMLKNIA